MTFSFWYKLIDLIQRDIPSTFRDLEGSFAIKYPATVTALLLAFAYITFRLDTGFLEQKMSAFRNNNTLHRFFPKRNQEIEDKILRKGGYVAGLVNDGNTCFMNSVLQSLASSNELMKFLDDVISQSLEEEQEAEVGVGNENEQVSDKETINGTSKSKKSYGKQKKKLNRRTQDESSLDEKGEADIRFTLALKDLLDKLNFKYYREMHYYKTNKLLKTMTKAPNKNIILGYEQEDAQEFFQTVLAELEKNVKSKSKNQKPNTEPIPQDQLPEDALIGQEHLDKIGTVYIPTEQIDPNRKSEETKYFSPFKLVTPLDGITAERIGCLQCGETGGIRYSISSGLSLNLPSENIGETLKLSGLLQEWIKPEIIEGVECNRCALLAVYEHLKQQQKQFSEKVEGSVPTKLVKAIEDRIKTLEETLAKPMINDEDYKKLYTENMVRKCSKSKQILISRPPPLLSIHINRSVFDPQTYMIRKNNSRVLFKSRLNLDPWCCNIDDINMDARLPMSKKEVELSESSEDENIGGEYYHRLHHKFEQEFEDSDGEDGVRNEISDRTHHYVKRDVSEYDPLNGEIGTSSEDEADGSVLTEEVDALGNTISSNVTTKQGQQYGSTSDDSVLSSPSDVEEILKKDEDTTSEFEDEEEEQEQQLGSLATGISASSAVTVPTGPLTYVLRSVIVHYGTHNYGHYIAFRRYRGCWWRISDETVYVVEEAEVLSTPGVFMLFYEYDYDEKSGKMKEDLSEVEIEVDEGIEKLDGKVQEHDEQEEQEANVSMTDEMSE